MASSLRALITTTTYVSRWMHYTNQTVSQSTFCHVTVTSSEPTSNESTRHNPSTSSSIIDILTDADRDASSHLDTTQTSPCPGPLSCLGCSLLGFQRGAENGRLKWRRRRRRHTVNGQLLLPTLQAATSRVPACSRPVTCYRADWLSSRSDCMPFFVISICRQPTGVDGDLMLSFSSFALLPPLHQTAPINHPTLRRWPLGPIALLDTEAGR